MTFIDYLAILGFVAFCTGSAVFLKFLVEGLIETFRPASKRSKYAPRPLDPWEK